MVRLVGNIKDTAWDVASSAKKFYQKHEVLRNFAAVLSVDILVKGSVFFLLPVYLKLMQQAQFGLYSYLISIVNMLGSLLFFGQNIAQTKIYFDGDGAAYRGRVLFNIHWLLLGLLTVTLVCVYFFRLDVLLINAILTNEFDYGAYRHFLLMAVLVSVYSGMLFNYLIIEKKIRRIQAFSLSKLVLTNALPLAALYWITAQQATLRLQCAYGAELLVVLVFIVPMLRQMVFRIDWAIVRKALKIGLPFLLATVPSLISIMADKVILERQGTFVDLSVYYLAFTLSSVVGIIAKSFNDVWMPNHFQERDPQKNLKRTHRLMGMLSLLFVGIGIALYLAILLMFKLDIIGKEYIQASTLLPFLICSQVALVFVGFYFLHLVYFEKTHYHSLINLLLLCPNVAINWWLIKRYGVEGAAWANLCSSLYTVVIYWLVVNRLVRKETNSEL